MKLLFSFFCLVAITCVPLNAQDLKGHVTNADGKPLANTLVAIYTAHPRVGPGVL